MQRGIARTRVLAVVPTADVRARVERVFAATPVELDSVADVETAYARLTESTVDCLLVAADRLDAPTTAFLEGVDLPVVLLVDPDGALSPEAAFDAGADDVVPVVDSNLFERLPERVTSAVAWRHRRDEASARITEELKEQAMDEAPVGITIADFSLPDRPLVYINDAYSSMTGYAAAEALGRNCRYLQGEETDSAPVDELRHAVEAEESASVELLNYRRNGETFWNRVDIAPISAPNGTVTHYVGFQTDITERVRAEEAAERYAAEADRERARLQRLVDHIEGLLQDVTNVLVRAETRAELEREVCERVAAAEPYACAWIGDCDLSPDAVVPKVWAGDDVASIVGLSIDRTRPDDPVARAVERRQLQTQQDANGQFHTGVRLPFETLIVIPLVHRETLYGVLAVYADPEAAADPEQVVLATLGRAVGAAIDAFESRRTLLTDEVLELEIAVSDPTERLVSLAAAADCRLDYEGVVTRDDGIVRLFVSVTPSDADLDVGERAGIERIRRLPRGSEVGLYEVALAPGSILQRVADAGGRLTDLSVDDRGVRLSLTVPDRSAGRALLERLESGARGVELRAVRDGESPPESRRGFVAAVEEDLTEKQLTALQLAYLGGFFDWPHGVTGNELAETMDISRATFHQHLRAAERKLVSRFFQQGPN